MKAPWNPAIEWSEVDACDASLWCELVRAHAASARRQNLSSQAIAHCAAAGVPFAQALAAALSTLGGNHAPVMEAMRYMRDGTAGLYRVKKPGWGNSFHQGEPDPLWQDVDKQLRRHPKAERWVYELDNGAPRRGLYPNPAGYTAVAALTFGVPDHMAQCLFIQLRLAVWVDIYREQWRAP